jgi:hypothetical protein
MKLNWFSPVPPTASSVALQTAAVLPSLAKQASITLWVHEAGWSPELEQHARVCRYNPGRMPWAEINAADATVYHLGNQAAVYGPIWQVNRQHSGIVVLYDLVLQPLIAGLVVEDRGLSRSEYHEMMKHHHPDGGLEAANDLLSRARTIDEIAPDFPLTGVALENATAVILHTQAAYSLVSSSTTLPVALVPIFNLSNGETDAVEAYVHGLLNVVKTTLDARAREAVRWMAGRTGRAMRPWFSETDAGLLITQVAQTIRDLVVDRPLPD